MPSTEVRIIDIRDWRAAHARAPRSSSAPLVIVFIVLILAGLVAFAMPLGTADPTSKPVQWHSWRP